MAFNCMFRKNYIYVSVLAAAMIFPGSLLSQKTPVSAAKEAAKQASAEDEAEEEEAPAAKPVKPLSGNAIPLKPAPPGVSIVRELLHCNNIRASNLAATLAALFPADELHLIVGPDTSSPKLEASPQHMPLNGTAAQVSKTLILMGHSTTVAAAKAMAGSIDRPRDQVRLRMKLMSISTDALRNLGVSYDFSRYSIRETTPNGASTSSSGILNSLKVLQLGHLPISIDATIKALETQNNVKSLAEPNLSILDGEKGFILIGQKLLYPKLTGYTSAQTPIYDKEEVSVGIYVQFSVDLIGDDEMILAVYPQVSTINGYLQAGGASYPQIGTSEEQTTVRVHSNETLVIGGMISDTEVRALSKIPFLANVPVLGELFKNRSRTSSKTDLVLMITPEVLKRGEGSGLIMPEGPASWTAPTTGQKTPRGAK